MTNTTLDISPKMKDWLDQYDAFQTNGGAWSPALKDIRAQAHQSFLAQGFPGTRQEAWKYTSVSKLVDGHYRHAHAAIQGNPAFSADLKDVPKWWETDAGQKVHLIVLPDSGFDAERSQILADDVIVIKELKQALEEDEALVLRAFGKLANNGDSAFVALNTALANNGLFVHVPKGKTAKYPIQIMQLGDGSAGDVATQKRIVVIAEENSELQLIEQWESRGTGSSFHNQVMETWLGENARVYHTVLQNDRKDASLINFHQVFQSKGSHYENVTITTGGKLVRNNLHAKHIGEHCETHMFGLYLLDGDQHTDNHTLVDHAMPNCYSNELYKGILDGKSTGVFNGKVMVRPDAQKTNAFQSNKTILLSEGATINTKPQLEIFADDVKCSHGATTGQLDETALFYMRSRGLSEKSARALLTYAFAADVLTHIRQPLLRKAMEDQIRNRLFPEFDTESI